VVAEVETASSVVLVALVDSAVPFLVLVEAVPLGRN
jgi:hypothetical protein